MSCVLGLTQLSSPEQLLTLWQAQLKPNTKKKWHQAQSLQPGIPLLELMDDVMGCLQQLLPLMQHISQVHTNLGWRKAAAAVFVEGRLLEQHISSDQVLYKSLKQILGLLQTQQLHGYAQSCQAAAGTKLQDAGPKEVHEESHAAIWPSDQHTQKAHMMNSAAATVAHRNQSNEYIQLCNHVTRHMQLEGLQAQVLALHSTDLACAGSSAFVYTI